ncbi:MAG TPA: phytanoyl-CoA dioxygenase family protein, partial [Planctomycetaceae bacterium]|nr:phytanoyl-CoA dioxygenase family protein [Planctomycetaceae bacterium]
EAIFFDKTPEANWMVPAHQDRFLPVQARCDEAGFSGWTKKEGVDYVTPPVAVLEQVVALRVHLDDCGADNGALWVSPASHARGLLTEDEVAALPRENFVACAADAGDVLLMRPLLVHRSLPAHTPTHRRVLHIVYACAEPGTHVRWKRANCV